MNAISEISSSSLQQQADALARAMDDLNPMLKKMRLLASNAVSAAARAGSEGDAFRVLTQGIQELGLEIKHEIDNSKELLLALADSQSEAEKKKLLFEIKSTLEELPAAVAKGDYLAIYCSVEAAHAESHATRFNSVAQMLKSLITDLREEIVKQKTLITNMLEEV
ncbi:MAG: hypothetical protein VX829_14365 [Pseudomonadota bacterium]|jgi:hypothetical protein|uniref:Methyl-accepting chemotaxis protein n=1 Tax=Methylophaga aminisulfidivorans MP TaxID=1026882 RepID=F5T2H6_9GAMM|nr:hypothetical protein [Methylophaga aminisulfidivorans]EGL53522.1 hypothetical protein MAMP_01220 [Methylophaga aminisulfidivorans MP]MEC9413847.1 hypothetical protein [Pseudomonadota bacterium]